jgi:hypothetical protein
MASSDVAVQLDSHHKPETNGRMSVCRRCGARTDSPEGLHHEVQEAQAPRHEQWLVAQSRLLDIEQARVLRGS